MSLKEFSPALDPGVRRYVEILHSNGVETFESCQGGEGHAYAEPAVRFHGPSAAGFHALSVAMHHALPVSVLRRIWPINDGEPTGPWWEMTFFKLDEATNPNTPRGE